MSDKETYAALVAEHGRCVCPSGLCLSGDQDAPDLCRLCEALDPEWDCPHDPEGASSYHQPVLAEAVHEGWGVFCDACSDAAQDHVWPCEAGRWNAPRVVVSVTDLALAKAENERLRKALEDWKGAHRIAGDAADRFRDVLSEVLGLDENPGDNALVAEIRRRHGKDGPEPRRWRDSVITPRPRERQQ